MRYTAESATWTNGQPHYHNRKGVEPRDSIVRRAVAEAIYGIKVQEIRP